MNLRFNEGKRERRKGLPAGVWLKLLPFAGCGPKTEAGAPEVPAPQHQMLSPPTHSNLPQFLGLQPGVGPGAVATPADLTQGGLPHAHFRLRGPRAEGSGVAGEGSRV